MGDQMPGHVDLLEAAAAPLLLVDGDALDYANKAATTLLRQPANALRGRPVVELLYPGDRPLFATWWAGSRGERLSVRLLTPDRPISATLVGQRLASNGHTLLTVNDDTEVRRLTVERQRSDALYQSLIEFVHDVILVADRHGQVDFISRSIERLIGLMPEAIVGRRVFDFLHPDDAALVRASANRPDARLELRIRHQDGRWVWCEISNAAVYLEQDGEVHHVSILRNIEDRKQVEEGVRLREARYRLLSELTSSFAYSAQLDPVVGLKPVWVTDNIEAVTSYTPEQLGSIQHWGSLIHPDDQIEYNQHLSTILSGKPSTCEYRLRAADGSDRWMHSTVRVELDPQTDQPLRMQGATQDVTERRRYEDALRVSRERLRLLTDNMLDIVMRLGLDGSVSYASPSARSIFGLHPAEIHNRSLYDFVAAEDRAIVRHALQALSTQREPQQAEFRIIHSDGSMLWLEMNAREITGPDGKPDSLAVSCRDVTARHIAEAALRASEAQLRTITENTHDLILVSSQEMRVSYASSALVPLCGCQPAEIIGKSFFDRIHPEDIERVQKRMAHGASREITEFRALHTDGYYFWVEMTVKPIQAGTGEMGFVLVLRDISERRWMQRALVEQERLLALLEKEQELNSLKARLMSRLSHELRTPLAVVATSAEMLLNYADQMTDDKRTTRLHQIRDQIARFSGMLDNMGLVMKGVSYRSDLTHNEYNVEKVIGDTIHDVVKVLRAQHNVQLDLHGLPVAQGDPQTLRLVTLNLLSNAIKFSPPTASVRVVVTVSENDVVLSVHDQGIGIPSEDQPHVFEPFFRGSNVGEVPGLGIGLSIVEEAVATCHGIIDLDSPVGQGTTVTVQVPLKAISRGKG